MGKPVKPVQLNLMGNFKNPWIRPAIEADHIEAWNWSPGMDTWQVIYGGKPIVTESLTQFLGAIQIQDERSITRINLVSHGMSGLIAFSGDIAEKDGSVMLDTTDPLDLSIEKDTYPIGMGKGLEKKTNGLMARELANRFAKDAFIVFYLCHSGSDRHLLQVIANIFRVVVKGFQSEIWYCPKVSRKPVLRIDRRFVSMNTCVTSTPHLDALRPNIICHPE